MIFSTRFMSFIISLVLLFAGCAQVPKEAGFNDVQDLVGQRVDYNIHWNQQTEADLEVEKAIEVRDAAQAAEKELRPRKERKSIYTYPDDCVTAQDKKKFRAKSRREKKKAEKDAEKAAKGGEDKKDAPPKKKLKKKTDTED